MFNACFIISGILRSKHWNNIWKNKLFRKSNFFPSKNDICYETILSGQFTYNKTPPKPGRALFTSFTFCKITSSYSLRLNKRIYICIHSSIFYLLELAFMTNLHNGLSRYCSLRGSTTRLFLVGPLKLSLAIFVV